MKTLISFSVLSLLLMACGVALAQSLPLNQQGLFYGITHLPLKNVIVPGHSTVKLMTFRGGITNVPGANVIGCTGFGKFEVFNPSGKQRALVKLQLFENNPMTGNVTIAPRGTTTLIGLAGDGYPNPLSGQKCIIDYSPYIENLGDGAVVVEYPGAGGNLEFSCHAVNKPSYVLTPMPNETCD